MARPLRLEGFSLNCRRYVISDPAADARTPYPPDARLDRALKILQKEIATISYMSRCDPIQLPTLRLIDGHMLVSRPGSSSGQDWISRACRALLSRGAATIYSLVVAVIVQPRHFIPPLTAFLAGVLHVALTPVA